MTVQVACAQGLQGELQARYRAFERAFQRHDAKYLYSHLSQTFTVHFPNGKEEGRVETLKGFEQIMNTARSIRWAFVLTDLTIVPNGVRVKANGVLRGTVVEEGKKLEAVLNGITLDTWILECNRWVLDRVEFVKLEGTIGGQPAQIAGVAP